MQVTSSNFLVQTDRFCDYIPVISTITNIVNLFFKCVVLPMMGQEAIANSHYYTHLDQKSFLECFALLIPILNIFVKIFSCCKSNSETTFTLHTQSADAENAQNMLELAVCYQQGITEQLNPEKAFRWFAKSADAGNAEAMYNLGICYELGEGTEENLEEAFAWYVKGSNTGSSEAMCNLGFCYLRGVGTEQNSKEAFALLTRSANAGNGRAMFHLSNIYQYGMGVEKNPQKAFEWHTKSANTRDPRVMNVLRDMRRAPALTQAILDVTYNI